ncbi:efflux RND transporter periplasmic adaptor subunit [Mucilaginibacter rubeus]|uniref:Efflux RND transporter periplasmic adaptor subunit n=1 Tax=Mucilaginibacter rubeus TaxID=2027860 RepID=A0AAE6JDQ2_9SPHI|nr:MULTISPECIES: efflux RND transporter periplasmic adaptor subunit [Mucilaginibacter]QEM03671.1 efflux RND transporter periplasmic adaptor subunit [Mucilaginibacter rubeus]QEM16282.1 efflux RND transporter periplasmic adaptor subunit [Mucilaginibacter gossypii]QTE40956.1 efflux RND transporter periplasmic adaptor subunit [Mucilaginibacter rubeus]QTE47559.1 efflux RND transporter periplasmic adaptor subunit [Mucilaginibacter rubeus]QTE58951.1 efflux RND transporter periplasmic adaptor subunit 
MKKQLIIKFSGLMIIVSLALSMSSCGGGGNKETAATTDTTKKKEESNVAEISDAQYSTLGVKLEAVSQKALSGVLKVNGFIDVPPQDLVSISTQMGGIVKSIPVLQGTVVKKGQVIAILENQDYVQLQQDYLDSKSQHDLNSAEYKRQQTLASQNVTATKILQQAKASYESSMAREAALRQRLRLINIDPDKLTPAGIRSTVNIYAPIGGYVTKVNTNVGKFVNPNDIMLEIVNSNNLHVELNVFERDAEKVKTGQTVRFTLTNDSTERQAIVSLVGKEINNDKTIRIHSIAKGSFNFLPGTYVKAFIETGKNATPALPETAVVNFEGKQYVFVSTGTTNEKRKDGDTKVYRFKMTPVTTGVNEGGYIAVQLPADMTANSQIVTKGAYDLLSKLKNSEEE